MELKKSNPIQKNILKGIIALAMYFLIASECGPLFFFTLFGIMDNRIIFLGYSIAILAVYLGYMVLYWVLPFRWAISLGVMLFMTSWLISKKLGFGTFMNG